MEIFSQSYDSLPSVSDQLSPPSESDSLSHSDEVFSGRRMNFSDEEVMLASCHSKKRSGRKKFKETRHPVYRGVRGRNSGKWVCELRQPNNNNNKKKTRIWLGTYPTAEMAARAHDVAAIALRGRSACLNFADSLWRLPIPAYGDTKDIQVTAALAAEKFRPLKYKEVVEERTVALPENVFFIDEDAESLWNKIQKAAVLAREKFRSMRSEEMVEERMQKITPENLFYVDENMVFEMPEILANIAEGLMLSPPDCSRDGYFDNDMEFSADMSLWSYSI